jgi:CBS domain-containing protein
LGAVIRDLMTDDPRTVDTGASAAEAARLMQDQTRVADVASRKVVTIDPEQLVDDAHRLMAKHQLRRLPVADVDGKLVGIVAQADIAKHVSASKIGEVVEKISN